MNAATKNGRLYLVPTPLDHGCDVEMPLDAVLPMATLQRAAGLTHWISENAKSTRAFLRRVGAQVALAAPIQSQHITELPRAVHKHGDHADSTRFDASALLAPALQGHDIGLISEAGMPAIADPGSSVVRAAHTLRIEVVPLIGPVSLMLALAASGLNGQSFAFVGYLPQDPAERTRRIQQLESRAVSSGQAQLMIETPYRNAALFEALLATLAPNTRLSIAQGLTLPEPLIRSAPIVQWRQPTEKTAALARLSHRLPCVFALGV